MPEGNKLTQKSNPTSTDLTIIWDSAAARLRNTPNQAMIDLTGNSINPIVGVSFSTPNLTFIFFDGTQQVIDIT